MQGYITNTTKKHAPRIAYVNQNQMTIAGFDAPFYKKHERNNRRVRLADSIPCDKLVGIYLKRFRVKSKGRPPLNPRVVIGSTIIKHMYNLDDRETVAQISKDMYL